MKTKTIVITVILLILAYLVFFTPDFKYNVIDKRTTAGGAELSPITQPAAEDRAVIPHFGDSNKNEIGTNLFSTVYIPSIDTTLNNVFYLYFDVRADLVGVKPTTVRISDVQIIDDAGNGKIINRDTTLAVWGCMLNDPFILSTDEPEHTWGAYGCAADGAWFPTTLLETVDEDGLDIVQPLLFRFKLKGEYTTILGTTRQAEKNAEIIMEFSEDDFQEGGFTAQIEFIDEDFIEECVEEETRICSGGIMLGSACQGAEQTCSGGLWAGCGYSVYEQNGISIGRSYTGSNEFTDRADWKTICTDGIDNDCDGFADKQGCIDCGGEAGINMDADWDCPPCVITFRTNAILNSLADDQNPSTYEDRYINIDTDGDGLIESYGYGRRGQKTGDCSGIIPIATTPLNHNKIYYEAGSVKMCMEGSPLGAHILLFHDDSPSRCAIGHPEYPSCLNERPTSPWSLRNQETCEDY